MDDTAFLQELLGPRYVVGGAIGHGAGSTVYRVIDRADADRVRVAKLFRMDTTESGESGPCAANEEFRLASRFAHPGLVRYYELSLHADKGLGVTLMEYVEGQPFGGQGIAPDVACQVAAQVLRALQLLHGWGWVHADVKPSNVLWRMGDAGPVARLLDYHLAFRPKALARPTSRGTLRYLAPEVVAGQAPTPASDLYSLGAVLFEALSGRPLFDGAPARVAFDHLMAPARNTGCVAVGEAVLGFIGRLLAKRPEGRFPDAWEALLALRQACPDIGPPETVETLLGRVRSVPLVGRERQVRLAEDLLTAPRSGIGALAITGEPGSGRTRFLDEVRVMAQGHGWRTNTVAAGREAVGQAMGRVRDVPPPEAYRDNRPLALLVDDLDQLGKEKLEALAATLEGKQTRPALFAFTLDATSSCTGEMRAWVDRHVPVGRCVQDVILGELDAESAQRLVRYALPAASPTTLGSDIAARCSPRPMVLLDTMTEIIEHGGLKIEPTGTIACPKGIENFLPASLRDETLAQMRDGSSALAALLHLLALDPAGVVLSVLTAASALEEDEARRVMRSGAGARLVAVGTASDGERCRLVHPGIAGLVREQVGDAAVAQAHDRLARAIGEARLGPAADRLAAVWHALQGQEPEKAARTVPGLLPEVRRRAGDDRAPEVVQLALSHSAGDERSVLLEAAADIQMARGRSQMAVDFLAEALSRDGSAGADGVRRRRKRGFALVGAGHAAAAEDDARKILAMPADNDDALRIEHGHAWLLLALVREHESRFTDADVACSEALTLGRRLGNRDLVAGALHRRGRQLLVQDRIAEAVRPIVLAAWALRPDRTTEGMAGILADLGYIAMSLGKWLRAEGFLERALAILRGRGIAQRTGYVLNHLASVYLMRLRPQEAEAIYQEALRLWGQLGDVRGQTTVHGNLAQVLTSLGRLDAAVYHAERACLLCPDDPLLRCHVVIRASRAHHALGGLSKAEAWCHEARGLAQRLGADAPRMMEMVHRLEGQIASLRGDLDAAESHLRAALHAAEENRLQDRQAQCLLRLAEVLLVRGSLHEAEQLAGRAVQVAEETKVPGILAGAYQSQGRVLLALRHHAEARTDLLRSYHLTANGGAWDELAEVTRLLGDCHRALGQRHFAGHYFAAALAVVEQVAGAIADPAARCTFVNDPRRQALFAAIREFREGQA